MLRRNIFCMLRCYHRQYSSKVLQVSLNDQSGVTTVELCKAPNSLSSELNSDFSSIIDELEASKSKGLILTSSVPNIFCAGFDLFSLATTDSEKLKQYLKSCESLFAKLYTSSFPTVAVINGQSPAGGCMIAMSCEYRVMTGLQYAIGLNETKIGLPVPFWMLELMRTTIGTRETEKAVTSGKLYKAEDALSVGLIDEIVDGENEAKEKANNFLHAQSLADSDMRNKAKQMVRRDLIALYNERKEEELNILVEIASRPTTRQKLQGYINAMKKQASK